MDLDTRGSRAATSLRDQVESSLDVDAARLAVAHGIQRRRTVHTVVISAGLTVAVVVVAGALFALSLVGGDGWGEDVASDSGRTAADLAILGALPRTPIDGRDSWRLPVVAKPLADLEEGAVVRVYGTGFEPGELVGVVMCAREAESEGAAGCMLGDADYAFAHVTSSTVYPDGTVVQDVPVRRHITTPSTGPVDCASEAERCLIAIGAAENYDRSGGTYVNFAGAPPFPEPTFAVEPAGPYTPGQTVTARATRLPAGRLYQVQQCAGDVCVPRARGFSAPDGTFTIEVPVNSAVEQDGEVVACAEVCTLQLTGVGPENATTAPFPDPLPLAFRPGAPVPEDQIPDPGTPSPPAEPGVPEEGTATTTGPGSTVPPDVEGTGSSVPAPPAPTSLPSSPPASTPSSSSPG